MLTILIGRAKTGKSDTMLRRMAELGESSQQILLVPEHASHQAEVDVCSACGDTASRHAEVLSFRRLSERVLSITGGIADVTLDNGGKLLTLQRALLETAPQMTVYRKPSQKVGFLEQMLALFDELRSYEVPPEILYQQAQDMDGATHDKLTDLSLLYAAYEARLRRPGLDARDRMTKLCDHLEESGYVRDKDIFIDGFTYFNAQERRALAIFLRQARSVTVTLLGEVNSREEIFEPTLKTMSMLERLAASEGKPVKLLSLTNEDPSALGHLERHFFGENLLYEGDSAAIRLREAATVYSEVEQTAADIRRLLAAGKCRCRDITVAARNMTEYAGTIETVFERYGIPVYLSRRSDILEKPVLSLLTGVLSSISNGYEYEDMFRWLKTGLAGLTAEECDLLENYVLKWDIHGQTWLRDEDWTENPDGYGAPWNDRRQAVLTQVNQLRRRVREPLERLAAGLKAGETARDYVEALYGFMEELKLETALTERMHAQAEAGRMQEAEETAQLWEILCGVLDQFVEILGEEHLEQSEFERLFRLVLTQYSVGTIPVALDQVSVSEITRNDRHTTSYLFLLGANDHVLPDPGQSGGLLNEDDRQALALRGVELAPTGMERMGIELQNLYAALAQPTAGLTVSYPVTDVSGSELRPAFVVERLRKLFPELRVEHERADKVYRLSAVEPALEMAGQDPDGPLWRYFQQEPDCARHLSAMERAAAARRGSLSPAAVRAIYGERVSMTASRLERMRSCHFAYFMEYGLRAKPREPASFDAPQIGTFLHYLLENVTRDVLRQGGFAAVDNKELHRLTRQYIDQYAEQELHNFQNRTPRFRYLFNRLRTNAYAIIDQVAEELRHSDFVPMAFELGFGGKDGTLPAVTISRPDGELRVGGKVDRVDGWVHDGRLYLRVVDYKTGTKKLNLREVYCGLDCQMLLYLFSLTRDKSGRFTGAEPAGVLYLLADPAPKTTNRQQAQQDVQYELDGLVRDEQKVFDAMDADETGRYLPFGYRNGAPSPYQKEKRADSAKLSRIQLHLDDLVTQMGEQLYGGQIDAEPLVVSSSKSPCTWCDYSFICCHETGVHERALEAPAKPFEPEEEPEEKEEQP